MSGIHPVMYQQFVELEQNQRLSEADRHLATLRHTGPETGRRLGALRRRLAGQLISAGEWLWPAAGYQPEDSPFVDAAPGKLAR